MKLIIAGGRSIHSFHAVYNAVMDSGWYPEITEIVSGNASGVDMNGEVFAEMFDLPLKVMPADWKAHGRKAGYIRNNEMACYADRLIAIWDGQSAGTKNMIDCMKRMKKPYIIYKYKVTGPQSKKAVVIFEKKIVS